MLHPSRQSLHQDGVGSRAARRRALPGPLARSCERGESMLSRILPLSLVAALALAVGAVAAADKTTTADKPAADNAVTGTVNAVADGKLTVSQKDGKDNVLSGAKDAEITLNGKKAELTDLKKGQSVTVTTAKNKDGDLVAAKVEATGSNSKVQ